jgi:hypothetical protein
METKFKTIKILSILNQILNSLSDQYFCYVSLFSSRLNLLKRTLWLFFEGKKSNYWTESTSSYQNVFTNYKKVSLFNYALNFWAILFPPFKWIVWLIIKWAFCAHFRNFKVQTNDWKLLDMIAIRERTNEKKKKKRISSLHLCTFWPTLDFAQCWQFGLHRLDPLSFLEKGQLRILCPKN